MFVMPTSIPLERKKGDWEKRFILLCVLRTISWYFQLRIYVLPGKFIFFAI